MSPTLYCIRCGRKATGADGDWNRGGFCMRVHEIGGGSALVECGGALHSPNEHARAVLSDENPDALWPDGFEEAYLGQARRCGQQALAAFSVRRCIQILMDRDSMTYEEADEFFEFNVNGAWMGAGTPIWVYDTDDDS